MPAPVIGRRVYSPTLRASIDNGHPLANGIVSCAVPAGSTFYDLARNELLTRGGTAGHGQVGLSTGPGVAMTGSSISTTRWEWSGVSWLPLSRISICLVHRKWDLTNRVGAAFGGDTSSFRNCNANLPNSTGDVYWDFGGNSETTNGGRLSVAGQTGFQNTNFWLFTAGATGEPQAIWRNGIQIAYAADRSNTRSSSTNFFLGNSAANRADVITIGLFAVWNRVLTDWEASMVTTDPFCFIRR